MVCGHQRAGHRQMLKLLRELRTLLADVESSARVLSSTACGVIEQAAGRQPTSVMTARGDLAVEIGYRRLAEMQEEILWLCEAASIPIIWVTQVLDAFVKAGIPTRAEITDAAAIGDSG
jgi:pyruvate kinase